MAPVQPVPTPTDPDELDLAELGRSLGGTTFFREYNPQFIGVRKFDVYEKMRKGDGQVRSTMRMAKVPIVSAEWYTEPASQDPQDVEIAAFVEWNRNAMSRSWKQVLWEALLMLDYGWYSFEKVYRQTEWRPPGSTRGPRKAVTAWQKLAPRHPRQLNEFMFDANGGVRAIKFEIEEPNSLVTRSTTIPIEKLLLFTFDEEGGQPEGFSLLRTVYKHWYYKEQFYKIDGIQKERHGIGVPDVALPPNATPKDKDLAVEMARNLRTNEKGEIVRPAGWEVGFAQLNSNLVNPLDSAEHHDMMIAKTLLVQFLNIGTTEAGTRATAGTLVDIFVKAQRYVADLIAEVFNSFCIPQLVDYNYSVDAYPKLRVRKIGEEADYRALSVALRNLIEGGAFTPTPEDEEYLRRVIDFPQAPKAAQTRGVSDRVRTKGAQGGAGPPESGPGAQADPANPADTSNRTVKPKDG